MENRQTFGKRNWWILLVFGFIGQIAWSVENMYFNLFVFETIAPDLDTVTLMVQLSGVTATVTTLVAGTLSDKIGNRRSLISYGYIIWGVTVALFGFLSTDATMKILGTTEAKAVSITLVAVVVADCVMTVFGSTANDAAFNAWVTDNTESSFRGKVEGVLAVLPLIAMLVVAGGFGIIASAIGYKWLFFALGVLISVSGIVGLKTVKDSPLLERKGSLKDIFYGFTPRVVKTNPALYLSLAVIGVYGIACQVFMPYLIIYMKTYLGFSVVEYSVVFGVAIVLGAVLNLYLGGLSDKTDKAKLLYIAVGVFALGLLAMYFARFESKILTLLAFGGAGFLMIAGYMFVFAITNALARDYTPVRDAGKLQGVRMTFSVLLPMIFGPMIGNAVNKAQALPLPDAGADIMTTQYIPAPEIFLVAALIAVLAFALIPLLVKKTAKKENENATENGV